MKSFVCVCNTTSLNLSSLFISDLPSIQKDLNQDFEPIIGAARHFLLTTLNSALITTATMFVLYTLGAIIFHFLKTREVFHVHYVYLVSNLSAFRVMQPLTPHLEAILELEDTEGASKSSMTTPVGTPQKRVQKYGLSVQFKSNSPSKTKTETLLHDMGYSETKV